MTESYLIFVIYFTRAGFFSPKFVHPKTMKYTQKLQQIPPKREKHAVYLRLIWKNLHLTYFFTRAPPVVPVTNMRYDVHPHTMFEDDQLTTFDEKGAKADQY